MQFVRHNALFFATALPLKIGLLSGCAALPDPQMIAACQPLSVREVLAEPSAYDGKTIRVIGYLSELSQSSSIEYAYSKPKSDREVSEFDERIVLSPADRDAFRRQNERRQAFAEKDGPFLIEGTFINQPLTYWFAPFDMKSPHYLNDAVFLKEC